MTPQEYAKQRVQSLESELNSLTTTKNRLYDEIMGYLDGGYLAPANLPEERIKPWDNARIAMERVLRRINEIEPELSYYRAVLSESNVALPTPDELRDFASKNNMLMSKALEKWEKDNMFFAYSPTAIIKAQLLADYDRKWVNADIPLWEKMSAAMKLKYLDQMFVEEETKHKDFSERDYYNKKVNDWSILKSEMTSLENKFWDYLINDLRSKKTFDPTLFKRFVNQMIVEKQAR